MSTLESSLEKLAAFAEHISKLLPQQANLEFNPDYSAFRYRKYPFGYSLDGIRDISPTRFSDLLGIDRQKQSVLTNTHQFIRGLPANNVLLWGPRGTGKSSLIKATLNEFQEQDLKMIEIDKSDLDHLPDLITIIAEQSQRFILYIDDLSFESGDGTYKSLKTALDGSLQNTPDNLLVYASSNRRHLMPEKMAENESSQMIHEEIHHSESIEERISLSERFGIWLSFHPLTQDDYLEIVWHYLKAWQMDQLDPHLTRAEALRWALERGSRSGRSAWQFAKSWAGRHQIGKL